jgi:L-serine dehydratase
MAHVGALDLFRIGVGPSSSHTVGPMRAARAFALEVDSAGLLPQVTGVHVSLYGSLGATGAGHGTTNALVRGLAGDEPHSCNTTELSTAYDSALERAQLSLLGHQVPFEQGNLSFHPLTMLPKHSNGMKFEAHGDGGEALLTSIYYSVGGGFIEGDDDTPGAGVFAVHDEDAVPYPYRSALELLDHVRSSGLSIAQLTLANDAAIHGLDTVHSTLKSVWSTMRGCIEQGLKSEGVLPGPLKVNRRAHAMAESLRHTEDQSDLSAQWLQAYAIAVNEENAAGSRVVTAPTNGAAGIIPAVAYWARAFKGCSDDDIIAVFLPTAAAIGSLYKRNASISGAEAGCQGEVGSACSMAAGGLTALLGGTPEQIENAAEIAMEHNLGLTCDPVGGFVQMPCIERNAIAAGTAVAATRLALLGDGDHKISLDTVIETMRQTGVDMSLKYKETSMGGLAVNVVEC